MKKNLLKLTDNRIFLFSVLVLLIGFVLSYNRLKKQATAANAVSNTQLSKFKLNDVFSHLLKAETAQRGYLLTADTRFLSDYNFSRRQIPQLLVEIKTLITDNSEQNYRLKSASLLFQTRLHYLETTVSFSGKMSKPYLDTMLLKGRAITHELDSIIDGMIGAENVLLMQRIKKKENEENRTSFFILIFSTVSIGILLYSYFNLKKKTVANTVLERKVDERTKEIKLLNETLQQQNVELKRKHEELSSFTFIANHDLREPLRKIELYSNELLESEESHWAEGKMLVQKNLQNVKRMKELLEDIFVYTMTATVSEVKLTDLNKTVAASVEKLHELVAEKKAIIELGQLPFIKAVPYQMEQLFSNLLSNSLKYSEKDEKPCIKIKAEKEKGTDGIVYWKITFADNGIGFDEAYKEKIFEMFKKLHPKHQYPGTGVGLAICRKIVENHKGTITASSKNGEGAIFTIILPET